MLITSAGQLLRFNGGGFDELERLPVYGTGYSWTSTAAASSLVGKVAARVVRNLEEGFALEFIHEQLAETLEDSVNSR